MHYIIIIIIPFILYYHYLIGGLEHLDYFSIQLGISSSQLTFIFFRGVGIDQPVIITMITG